MRLSEAEARLANLYGLASVLRGIVVGLGFAGLAGLAIGYTLGVCAILGGLAVAFFVGAKFIEAYADLE